MVTTFVDRIKQKGLQQIDRANRLREQAKEAIPSAYHGYILALDQRVKLVDSQVEELKNEPGFAVYGSKTYAEVSLPYVAVDGRVRMAVDEHAKAEKMLDVSFETRWTREAKELLGAASMEGTLDAEAVKTILAAIPEGLKNILTCTAQSYIRGTFEGDAKIAWDGMGVDRTNPYENAQTSALGRALGNMGYGLLGGGIASYEEVKQAVAEREEIEKKPEGPPIPSPRPAPTGNANNPTAENAKNNSPQNVTLPEDGGGPQEPKSDTALPKPSDEALTRTDGNCFDCGQPLKPPVIKFITKQRENGKPTRWAHTSVKGLTCPKEATT